MSERSNPSLSEPMPPPPPSRELDRESWVISQIEAVRAAGKEALRVSNEALAVASEARDAALRTELKIGQSPDAAQGIEGKGLLGVLHNIVIAREDERKRNAFLRAMLTGAVGAMGVAATVAGLLKAFGFLH